MNRANEKSFKTEQLMKGKFGFDYLPMWRFLDNLEKKTALTGGLSSLRMEEIWKAIYEFGVISVSLDKADWQSRVDTLNEQNLKWHMKAMELEAENAILKQKLQENLPFSINC